MFLISSSFNFIEPVFSLSKISNFISSSDYSYSYTIVNTDVEIIGSGDDGNLFNDSTTAYFSTSEIDFDSAQVDDETVIVITSMIVGSSTLTEKDEIIESVEGIKPKEIHRFRKRLTE